MTTDKKNAMQKMARFCAYQERTQQEVREKLYQLRIFSEDAEDIIATLIEENYINEERFAKTFAGGKFRIKKWGKQKIEQALKQKRISDYCIKQGLTEITELDYLKTLQEILTKKYAILSEEKNSVIRKNKTIQYALAKGYEMDLILQMMKEF